MATIRRRNEWKLGTSGQYERVLGWLGASDETPKRPKFYLGRDEASARDRSAKLETMWSRIEALYPKPNDARWGDEFLKIAKTVAKGDMVFPVPRWLFGGGELYLQHLCKLANLFPVIQFVPGDAEHLAAGVQAHQKAITKAEEEIADRREILKVAGAKVAPTGGPALHEALDAFKAYLKTDPKLIDPTTGEVKAWYYKRENMLDRLKERHTNLRFAAMDLEECEKIINYWRGRPPVKTRKTMMTVESAVKQIEEFKRFAKWLHRSKRFDWRKPDGFDDLDCSVRATANEVAKRALRMERAALVDICWEMMDRTSIPNRSRSRRSVNGPTASITARITGSAARRWRRALRMSVCFRIVAPCGLSRHQEPAPSPEGGGRRVSA
jgi:hypothetical protein